jgi:hypothetical protein
MLIGFFLDKIRLNFLILKKNKIDNQVLTKSILKLTNV